MFSKKPSEEVIPEPVVVTISALFDGSKDAQERMMELRAVERMESSRGSIISIPLETSEELCMPQAEHILHSGSNVT